MPQFRSERSQISADIEEFLATVCAQLVAALRGQFGKRIGNHVAGRADYLLRRAMGAAHGLGNDRVDDAETLQVSAVIFMLVAASLARVESRQRIDAAPSGEMTE